MNAVAGGIERDGWMVLRRWNSWVLCVDKEGKTLAIDHDSGYPITHDRWADTDWEKQLSIKTWCQGQTYYDFVTALNFARCLSKDQRAKLCKASIILRRWS